MTTSTTKMFLTTFLDDDFDDGYDSDVDNHDHQVIGKRTLPGSEKKFYFNPSGELSSIVVTVNQ